MQIRFLGHAAFELSDGSVSVVVDPFLTGNPVAACGADDVDPTAILLTHGHGDHLGDTVAIAQRVGAPVLAIHELAGELTAAGVDARGANLGGTVTFPWGWVRLVPAWHTAVSPAGTPHAPAGLVIGFGDVVVYHLGDTCLFSDLALVSRRDTVDVALVCIGGHFTMDRFDAVEAVRLIGARTVIPCHYDTMPVLRTDVEAFKADVEQQTDAACRVLAPGASHTVAAR